MQLSAFTAVAALKCFAFCFDNCFVIYNLTSQKTVSYEISEDCAVCELNVLGEIALFNNQNKAIPNDNNENNSNTKELKIVIFTLACLNIVLFVICIIFIYKIKTKKNIN